MTQESILRIVIDSRNAERNAHALANELESIEKKGDYATKSMDSMSVATRQLAGYMAGIVTIGAAINKMDAYTSINNKLKLVTNSQAELNQAMQDTFAIAQRSASAWGAVNDVYSKYMSNAKTLNLTQTQTARLTEITSKAVAISGSTTESAAGALFQYGQALDGNILRSEEYNALVDGAGGLLGAMAKGLGVTRGELRQMMLDGKLTGEVITKALLKAGDSVDELFNKTDITIGQSLTILNDSVTKFVGEASTGSGAATVLAGSIRVLADNLDLIADGAIVLGIGYVTTAIATKTLAVKADIVATLAQRAITQAQAIEEVKLATAATNNAKAHLALTQATAAATQAKFGATAAATKYKMATDAVTQAVIRQEVAEKAAFGATVNMSRASAGLLGFLGGPLGIGLTLATVAAGYMLMRDNASKATAAIDIQGQSVDDLVVKYRELNTLQRDNETKALTDQVEELSLKFRVASSDLVSFMQALPVSDEKINTWSKLHSQFSLGKISSDDYYKSIKALNILNDDQLNKVRGLIGGYESSNTKVKEAETAQKALATATKKTTTDIKNQAVSIAKLSDEIKGLLKEADKNSVTSAVTANLASRGYNDELISIVNKYVTVEGAITKNLQGQSVFRDEIKAKIEQEYTAAMKAKNAVDARNESEKERTKELEKQQKVLQVSAKVQANAAKYNFSGLESKYGLPNGMLSSLHAIETGNSGKTNQVNKQSGATGGFQFLKGTAEQYEVKDRTNMAQSAEGAAKYMAYLLKLFKGDLEKAVRAYHAGEGNVQNGKNIGKYNNDYWQKFKGYSAGVNGYSAGDLGSKDWEKQLEEAARMAEEQAELRKTMELNIATEVTRIRSKLTDDLQEIDKAGYSPERTNELKAEYQARADNDIAIANYALKTKADSFSDYLKTEEQLLQDSYAARQFEISHDLELTKEQREQAVKHLGDQLQQELALVKLAKEQRMFQMREQFLSETEAMEEHYRIEHLRIVETNDLEERNFKQQMLRLQKQEEVRNRLNGAVQSWGQTEAEMNSTGDQWQLEQTRFSRYGQSQQLFDSQMSNLDQQEQDPTADLNEIALLREQAWFAHHDRLKKIETDYQVSSMQLQLSYGEQMASSMTTMMGAIFGEKSRAYAAAFAIEKGFAVAQAALAMGQNIAEASKAGFPYNIPLIAGAMAQGAQIASIISSVAAPTGYATGGLIRGPGTGTSDSIPIMASDKEFMIRAASVKSIGTENLDYINKYGELPQNTNRVGINTINAINNSGAIQAEKQAQANAKAQSQSPQVIDNNLRVIMVKDENEAKDWLYSPEGERAFLYHMKRNRSKV